MFRPTSETLMLDVRNADPGIAGGAGIGSALKAVTAGSRAARSAATSVSTASVPPICPSVSTMSDTFPRASAASSFARRVSSESQRPSVFVASRRSLAEAFASSTADRPFADVLKAWEDTWLDLQPSTAARYQQIIRAHLLPALALPNTQSRRPTSIGVTIKSGKVYIFTATWEGDRLRGGRME